MSEKQIVWVDEDEWWPVYDIREEGRGLVAEATAEQVERWTKAAEAFDAVQKEMKELHREATDKAQAKAEAERRERVAAATAEMERKEAERVRQREESEARHRAEQRRLAATNGPVFDAAGKPIGRLLHGKFTLEPNRGTA